MSETWTLVGPRNHVLGGGPDPLGEGTILSQSYLVGGSSNAAFHCQYNLLYCIVYMFRPNSICYVVLGGSVAEWLACWTRAR